MTKETGGNWKKRWIAMHNIYDIIAYIFELNSKELEMIEILMSNIGSCF